MIIVEKIYQFARQIPDRPAVIADLVPCGYLAFARRIASLRRAFARRGLAPGGVVVSLIDDIFVSWCVNLALRSSGHTTMSVRTADELSLLGELDVRALLRLEGEQWANVAAALPAGAQTITLSPADWESELDPGVDEPPMGPPVSHILLTSGTTGRYKMVDWGPDVAQRAYDALEASRAQWEALYPDGSRMLVFDFGLWTGTGFGAGIVWAFGNTLVIHQGPSPWRSLAVPGCTTATATPAMLAALMAAPEGAFARNDQLRLTVVAGGLSERLFEQVRARLTTNITVTLASTEGGVVGSSQPKSVEDLRWHTPAADRVVEIVDEHDQVLPAGKVGQVRIKQTETATRGYLNDAEASDAFFRDGYFYPGDLGVIDAQGRLAMVGRVTDVLNAHGDKLPAGPYEEAVSGELGLDVCLLSEPGLTGGEELHVVIETPAPVEAEWLSQVAARRLAPFRPTIHFHFTAELPRNHMGKIERLRLRQMLAARRQTPA